MIDSLLAAVGSVFASGLGVLLLAALAALIVVLWDWRLALAGGAGLQLAVAALLVFVHGVPGVIAAGQTLAALLGAALLATAAWLHPDGLAGRQAGNWPLRLMALLFALGAWWFLDPGFTLPQFSQLETDLLLWLAISSLVLLAFSSSPLYGGAAVLLWTIPLFALAAVLLPGSGLAVMVGIMQLLVVLACGYLVLVEPAPAAGPRRWLPWRVAEGSRIAGQSGAQSGIVLPGGQFGGQPGGQPGDPAPRPLLRRPFGRRPGARPAAGNPPANAAASGAPPASAPPASMPPAGVPSVEEKPA